MKPENLIVILVFITGLVYGQSELPYVHDSQAPEWANMMYADLAKPEPVIEAYQHYYQSQPFKKTKHTQFYKRWIRSLKRELNPSSHKAYLGRIESTHSARTNSTGNWSSIGPWDWDHTAASRSSTPGAAHFYVIRQSPSHPDILYSGSATAGIWKSEDRGLSWTATTDHLMTNEVQALAIHPTDPQIVYAGIVNTLMKTTDGGISWQPTGDSSFQSESFFIKDVWVHPTADSVILFAGVEGLYRSSNGGQDWTEIINGHFLEVENHPTHPDTIYVVKKLSSSTEFYRSVDGGQTFELKINGWPSVDAGDDQQRTEIAVSPAQPDLIMALAAGDANGFDGLFGVYKSDNAGETWTFECCGSGPGGQASASNKNILGYEQDGTENGGQYYYDLALAISPSNTDSIFAAGINFWISGDGGMDFTCLANWNQPQNEAYVHADIHDIIVHEQTNEIWVACDGGLFYSNDLGQSFERRVFGISGTDFLGFDAGFWDGEVMIGGVFHNATFLKDNDVYFNGWMSTDNNGDGIRGFVNFGLDRIAFSDIDMKTLPGDRNVEISTIPYDHKPNASPIPGESSKIAFHPWSYNTWLSGENTLLWKTTDQGETFELLYDFTENVADIEISWANPNVIYVSTNPSLFSNKKIYRSVDGGFNWVDITIPLGLQGSNFLANFDLTLNPEDPLELWAARIPPFVSSSYDGLMVYQSTDGGVNWFNITTSDLDGELPTNIVHQVGTDGGLYLGTRRAVYYKNESMSNWQLFNSGLPVSTYSTKLVPYYKEGVMRNATNRSVWESDFFEASDLRAMPSADQLIIECEDDSIQFIDHSVMRGEGATWLWEFPNGSPATSTIRNPKVKFNSPGGQTVILTVTDNYGTDHRVFHDFILVKDGCGVDTLAGKAVRLNEFPEYVQLPEFNMLVDTFSITAWIRPNGIQNNFSAIIMNDNQSGGMHFHQGNNTLGYHWPGGSNTWDSGLIVPANQWSHVAMVVTPSQVTLYVNGESSTHIEPVNSLNLTTMKIGNFKNLSGRNFEGVIDEVAIWTSALTEDDIRLKRHLTKYIENEPDLLAYYQFNQVGVDVIDKVGGYNGVLNENATKISSKAPVGGGVSAKLIVNIGGAKVFPGTNLTIGFPTSGLFPNGEIVVTRINNLPSSVPNGKVGLTNGYWIVNNYGSSFFSDLNNIKIDQAGFFSSAMINETNMGTLYHRGENSDGGWSLVNANSISISPDLEATINHNNLVDMDHLDQWLIVRDKFPNQSADISIIHPSVSDDLIEGGQSRLPGLKGIDVGILLPILTDQQLLSIPTPASGAIAYGDERNTIVYFDGTNWQNIVTIPESIPVTSSSSVLGTVTLNGDSTAKPNVILNLRGPVGYLIPTRLTSADLLNIDFPTSGMIVYETDQNQLHCFDGARWFAFQSFSENDGYNNTTPLDSIPGVVLGSIVKDPNAVFEVGSTDRAFALPPANPENIANPERGLLIFDSSRGGFYVFDGINWKRLH